MKVRQLIERLKDLPPEVDVVIPDWDYGCQEVNDVRLTWHSKGGNELSERQAMHQKNPTLKVVIES